MGLKRPIVEGQQPSTRPSAAQSLNERFGGTFRQTFRSTLDTVFERGMSGEFDDQTIALEEQAALQRLRIAQQQASSEIVPNRDTSVEDGIGANAAPTAPTPAVSGGGSTGASNAVAAQREVYALRVRQSEARLLNISSSLRRDFPLAEQLASASTGTWDPETFVPQTREQAAALAHRLVIDATESAARLEILKTQLDAARFELAQAGQGGNSDLTQRIASLEQAYDRQKIYVDKLAKVVDRQSGGQMSEAGSDALAGQTLRGANDLPVAEIAAALRSEGFSEDQIRRVVGATEVAVEQEVTPDGSPRLKKMASAMTKALLAEFNSRVEKNAKETRRQENERAERQRSEKKRDERKQADERAVTKHRQVQDAREILVAQAQMARSSMRQAEFEQWINALALRSSNRREAS